jgi:pimeloyl-ACP methyl ester carboxylesterase
MLESGVSLSIAAAGDPSGPALVLLPGPTDSWRSYGPVLEHLPDWINAIAVSQRGHGDSDKVATGYRVQDFAADVPQLLDALGTSRAVLAGHSGSCLVARRVALDHAERVVGLVLESSPTTLRGHAGLMEFVTSVVSKLEDQIDPAFARSFVADTSSDHVAPELVDQLTAELMKVPVRVWKEMFGALAEYDDLVEIDRITVPTLLVWGDADDLVDHDMQTLLAERIGDAERLVYQGAGHTPRWEDPRRFASDVADFVERRALHVRA